MNQKKMHYKMYKRGKMWIFAGLTVTTFFFADQLRVQAATPEMETGSPVQVIPPTAAGSKNVSVVNETGSEKLTNVTDPLQPATSAAPAADEESAVSSATSTAPESTDSAPGTS